MVRISRSKLENPEYNNEMILLARESRGMTLQELADAIEGTKGSLSKIENGEVIPTEETMHKISTALDYPIHFFKQKEDVLDLDRFYYRKKLTTSQKDIRRSEANVNITRIHVEKLLNLVEPPEPNFPTYNLGNGNTPEDAARLVREYYKIQGKIEDLTTLLEDNGILIVPIDFQGVNIDGLSIVTDKGTPIIFVSRSIPADRTRLTIAHEFAHIVLHIGQQINEQERDVELEAFQFGASLLMPGELIINDLEGSSLTIEKLMELKPAWKVSMGALIMRAKQLGTLTQEEYEILWKRMSKQGYRKRGPEELDFPKEAPTLLSEIIKAHYNELLYSEKELANYLCLNYKEFTSYYPQKKPKVQIVRTRS